MSNIIKTKINIAKKIFWENRVAISFGFVLLVGAVLHGVNMFHYPYIESDEATYVSQAWSSSNEGELSPYTYWYDHPPLGWFTLSTWVDVLGGDWFLFGNSINVGRVLMLILHLIQLRMLMLIVRRVTNSWKLAAFAGLLYTFSPLAVYYQRRILLDNIMVTWLMASVYFLHKKKIRMGDILMSSTSYALAILTKVTAVMFGPAMLLLLLMNKKAYEVKKNWRTSMWIAVSALITLLWPIYALIKTELFQTDERVSLINTLLFQASRGGNIPVFSEGSSFLNALGSWSYNDYPTLIIIGLSIIFSCYLVFRKKYRFFGVATLLYTYFLVRGGIVLNFYIIPLLPFSVMSLVLGIHEIISFVKNKFFRYLKSITIVSAVLLFSLFWIYYSENIYKYLSRDEVSNQWAAIDWVKENLPDDARILSDIVGYVELHDSRYVNDKIFTNYDWYIKVARDPEIRFDKYNGDWRSFDYVLVSHEMLSQTQIAQLPIIRDAIVNSRPVMAWMDGIDAFVDVQKFKSTNGDWAAIYKINQSTDTQLKFAWNYYRDNYIQSYGQVVDPSNGVTTSEGQAYAMLRAALMNDKDTFEGVWLWTQHHLQFRQTDRLLSWKWQNNKQIDSSVATDADLDAAAALMFASKIFREPQYLEDAKELIENLWDHAVVEIDRTYYLLPTVEVAADRGNQYLLNPSYFSPAYYRMFAEVDDNPDHNWEKLADDTYLILDKLSRYYGNSNGLIANWVMVNKNNGNFSDARIYITDPNQGDFGFDAFRIIWRVALDDAWYETKEAKAYLDKIGSYFNRIYNGNNWRAIRTTNGSSVADYYSPGIDAVILSAIRQSQGAQVSALIYEKLFTQTYVQSEDEEYAYWYDKSNYYDSNWIWFGLALYNNNLPNLWQYYEDLEQESQ